MARRALAIAALLATCAAGAACSKPPPGPAPDPSPGAPSMPASTSESDARAQITRAFVQRFDGADGDAVRITFHDRGELPGVRLFQAVTRQPDLREDHQVGLRGVIVGGELVTDPVARLDALVAAMVAHGLDEQPGAFARLAGRLETIGRDGSQAVTEQRMLDRYRAAGSERGKRAFLPRRTTVDGHPTIEYYTVSPVDGREGPTRVVMPEGKPIVRQKQGPDGAWKVDEGFDR